MTDDAPPTMPGGWYVAFFDGPKRHWWWPLCRPGFRHCLAFAYDARLAVWLVYEVTERRTWLQAMTSAEMDGWIAGLPPRHTILHLEGGEDVSVPRLGFWCTPAVAHLVGARSRALRPQALYRDLVLQGARPAFEGGES